MTLAFSVLASGSQGNCTLLRVGERIVLIDAGLSPGETERRLADHGVTLDDVDHILLTHLDHDHYHRGWAKWLEELDLRVHVHRRHQGRAANCGVAGRCLEVFDADFDLDDATRVQVALVAHDAVGCTAYVIEHGGVRFGLATDVGRVTRGLLELFHDLDALALESNYDAPMQRAADRPDFIKYRVMSGQGHLSNEQALEAILDIAARGRLDRLALIHLSQQCNDTALVKRLYARRAPELVPVLTIASQDHATELLEVRARARQLPLF